MRIALISRFPLADVKPWKRQLAVELREDGHELLLLYSRKSVYDHLGFGYDLLRTRRPAAGGGSAESAGGGRSRALGALPPTTLARWARGEGVPVSRHRRLSDPGCLRALDSFQPDLGILVGADLVPEVIISRARIGMLNPHYGLLPAYRGMNVAEWSIYNGDPVGVSIHWVDPGVDTGAILLTEELPLYRGDTLADLRRRQRAASARLLAEAVRRIGAGTAERIPQRAEDGRQYYRMHPALLERVEAMLASGEYPHLAEPQPG